MSQSTAFVGAFYDARYICHDERLVIVIADYSNAWFKSGEGIVCNLWVGCRHRGKEGGFSGIGEPDQTYIGEHFHLQYEPAFASTLSFLGELRSLAGCCLEEGVTLAASSAFEQGASLPVFSYFSYDFSGFGVFGNCSQRNFQDDIFGVCSRAEVAAAVFSVFCGDVFAVFEADESPHLAVALHYDTSSLSAVPAVRSAFVYELFSMQVHGAVPSVAGSEVEFHIIYKICVGHIPNVLSIVIQVLLLL